MKRLLPFRTTQAPAAAMRGVGRLAVRGGIYLTVSILVLLGTTGLPAQGTAATQSLLEKAHTLEVRGRMDMASQTWEQVLLSDPKNAEALGGLARAAKLAGNMGLANAYLDRLRAVNPKDPNIARVRR